MSHIGRAVIAVAAVLAFAAVPLAAEWCEISCEAAQSRTAVTEPACHHASSRITRVGHVPTPCGHDHRPSVVDTVATTPAAARAAALLPASTPAVASAIAPLAALTSWAAPLLRPSAALLPLALSSTLRI
jgi:hypothetical protein